jgi:hypothetical protein
VVALFLRHVEELGVVGEVGRQVADDDDDVFQRLLLFAQGLGALGVVPDGGVFEFGVDFGEAAGLFVPVKDTSGAQRCAESGRRSGRPGR